MFLQSDTAILYLRSYFAATSLGILFVHFVPFLHKAFIPYGKTRSGVLKDEFSIIGLVANIAVPKVWFWHYYLISVSLSIASGWQLVECSSNKSLCIVDWLGRVDGRILLVWGMMLVQGSRRLYESLFVIKASDAKMWIGHYLVGCVFYIMICLSIFADAGTRGTGRNYKLDSSNF
jgi:3-oxo-5-alpha-steroid 4-dehydrogenase 3 / polyprenol reductase